MVAPTSTPSAKGFSYVAFQQMRSRAGRLRTPAGPSHMKPSIDINIVTCTTNIFRASSSTPTRVEQAADDATAAMHLYGFGVDADLSADGIELVIGALEYAAEAGVHLAKHEGQ